MVLGLSGALGEGGASGQSGASSGYVYINTTGEYYPGWYADNCLESEVTFPGYVNESNVYSHLSGAQCSGPNANMQVNWVGAAAYGYLNGSLCGTIGWIYNSVPSTGIGVGAKLCSGTGSYNTIAWGEWWDDVNGTWEYSFPGEVNSTWLYGQT